MGNFSLFSMKQIKINAAICEWILCDDDREKKKKFKIVAKLIKNEKH